MPHTCRCGICRFEMSPQFIVPQGEIVNPHVLPYYEVELMRRWMEFYKGTLQNIAGLGHPASVIAEQALAVKVLPGSASDANAEPKL